MACTLCSRLAVPGQGGMCLTFSHAHPLSCGCANTILVLSSTTFRVPVGHKQLEHIHVTVMSQLVIMWLP